MPRDGIYDRRVRLAQGCHREAAGAEGLQKAASAVPGPGNSVACALRGTRPRRFWLQCPALPGAEGVNQPRDFGKRPAFQPDAAL